MSNALTCIRTELDGFIQNRRIFITYQDKVYSITDPVFSQMDLEIVKNDGLREPNILLILATERIQQKRRAPEPKRLRLVQ